MSGIPYIRESVILVVTPPIPSNVSLSLINGSIGADTFNVRVAALSKEVSGDTTTAVAGIASPVQQITTGADPNDGFKISFDYIDGQRYYRVYVDNGVSYQYKDIDITTDATINTSTNKVEYDVTSLGGWTAGYPSGEPKNTIATGRFTGEVTLPSPQIEYESMWEVGSIEPTLILQKQREISGTINGVVVDGHFLRSALGAASRTGSGPYTHTYTPGRPLPPLDILAELTNLDLAGSSQKMRFKECIIDSITITAEENEALKYEMSIIGKDYETWSNTLTAPSAVTTQPFMFYHGTFKFGSWGTIAHVNSIELSINNNVEAKFYASRTPTKLVAQRMEASVTANLDVVNTTVWNHIANSGSDISKLDTSALEFDFVKGSDTLRFKLINAYPKPGQYSIPEQGRINLDVEFFFENLQVILIDSVANYAL